MTAHEAIPLYGDGQWATCDHPVDDAADDYEDALANVGYALATHLRSAGNESAVTLTVWGEGAHLLQRPVAGSPKYLIDVTFSEGKFETVAASSIVDLMDLLAMWSPVARARTGFLPDE